MLRYRTRYSTLLLIVLGVVSLAIFIPVEVDAFQSGKASEVYKSLGIMVLYFVILIGSIKTDYIIDLERRRLIITSMYGLSRSRKDIMKMTRIRSTRTWASAPASSLKRIWIEYPVSRFGSELILSPYMQDDFIEQLRKINPEIVDETK